MRVAQCLSDFLDRHPEGCRKLPNDFWRHVATDSATFPAAKCRGWDPCRVGNLGQVEPRLFTEAPKVPGARVVIG